MVAQIDEIVVHLADEADTEWCCRTATLAGREFVYQRPGMRDLVVAERDGTRVGLLIVDYLWAGLPHSLPFLSFVDVLREHQRRGVGTAMLAFVEARLQAQGHFVLLSSCTADELEPQAWHRHTGFEDCGRWDAFTELKGEVFFAKRLGGVE